jgi:glycosyltransferase involved in cell wall biosynthesis
MNISILLSAYNGELFLKDQIESILSQTNKQWCLYIRDDGSKDNTIDIINFYTKNYPAQIIQIKDEEGNLGSDQSFMKMLSVVDSEYYMFCDQDDIWLPFKIELTLKKIKEVEAVNPDKGILVFTNLAVVETDLKMINNSMWDYNKIDPENAKDFYKTTCLSTITGCTLMFNDAIRQAALPYPKVALMHDWWISLNAVHFGIVDYLNTSTVLYRQHANNVLGAKELDKNHYLRRLLSLTETMKDNFKVFKMLNALEFKVNFPKVFLTKIKILIKKITTK